MPNTEQPGRPITVPNNEKYEPMAFGPVGRGWEPRHQLAGTYDDGWLKECHPFLPPDFDEHYFQAAPLDQQIAYPQGGEEIVLVNLTPGGRAAFTLPVFAAPVHYFPKRGPREDGKLVLDTIVIEPDLDRFSLTWRATRPLRKNMLELSQVLVGRKGREWWQQSEEVLFPLVFVPFRSPEDDAE
jgi:hypothetical protein